MLKTAHLFANVGGGILADLLNGHCPSLAIEYNPHKCAVLRHRYPGLAVAEGDCHQMDFHAWRGRVDALHAGVPCPKWSKARHGLGETLDLLPEVTRITSHIRPKWVFLECVEGFSKEIVRISDDFVRIGYTVARPLILSAASVGAPHHRKRCWIAAHADDYGEPVVPVYAETCWLPEPDPTPWEADAESLQVVDGMADRWEMECAGDGQVPLCAAVAWRMLGLPYS